MLRILGGEWRNRSVKWLESPDLRPTSSKVREALFQIMGADLPGAVFWDLCAGSGIMGMEALSRGASEVWFVEKNRRSSGLIRQNLEKYEAQDRTQVIPADVLVFLRRARPKADLVFIDPPYASGVYLPLLEVLDQTVQVWGSGKTRLCLEHRKNRDMEHLELKNWVWEETRKYGDTCLTFLTQASPTS
jgi:16S rRNA (guanine966-N2)-methyltransferase